MILLVAAMSKDTEEENWSKMKIKVGYVMTRKFIAVEYKTREGRISRMWKEVVVCVQSVAEKNKFLVKLKYVHSRDMSSCLLLYVCSEEEVGQEVN